MSERKRRIEQEAELIRKHSGSGDDRRVETVATKHVLEETDAGCGKEQDKLGPLIEQGRARAYK